MAFNLLRAFLHSEPLRRVTRHIPKRLGQIAISFALICFAAAFGFEAFDRLGDSDARFAFSQLTRELNSERTALEEETLELLDEIATETQLPAIRWVRVGIANGLGSMDFTGRFNPTTFRIAIDPKLSAMSPSERRFILIHEIGHAVAFASGSARPRYFSASPQANAIVTESLLSNQIYQEAYADAFATAWILRKSPMDPVAHRNLARAIGAPQTHSSPAHDTTQALRLLRKDMPLVKSIPSPDLPGFLAVLSSEASALTIAQLGAEREAACHMGARGLARFALDMGYESFYLPWEMAQTHPIAMDDPLRDGLSHLASLRSPGSAPDPWAKALTRAKPAIDQALSASKAGASPEQASRLAWRGMALMHQNAIPFELNAAAFAAKLTSTTRTGWRAASAEAAMGLAESFWPTPTYGCRTHSALEALRKP